MSTERSHAPSTVTEEGHVAPTAPIEGSIVTSYVVIGGVVMPVDPTDPNSGLISEEGHAAAVSVTEQGHAA